MMFVPGKPFQPSLIFVGMARAYPIVGYLQCITWLGSSLTRRHKIRLERLARDKHFSFLRKFLNYRQKSFVTLALYRKLYYSRN